MFLRFDQNDNTNTHTHIPGVCALILWFISLHAPIKNVTNNKQTDGFALLRLGCLKRNMPKQLDDSIYPNQYYQKTMVFGGIIFENPYVEFLQAFFGDVWNAVDNMGCLAAPLPSGGLGECILTLN